MTSRCFSAGLCLLAVFVLLAPSPAEAQSGSNGFWQTQSIYQIFTDRFFDGDPSNNNADGNYNASNSGSVHGGDFRGIEQKLDYIKALGATAIWISPVVLNANGEYHGYAGRDFYSVDPHWGSLADLQHMIQAAHDRGLLVIDDIICNHGGDLVYSTDYGYANFLAPPSGYTLRYRVASKQYAPPFNTNSINPTLNALFHNNGAIADYNNTQQAELGELAGLDDFRTETAYVRTNMAAIYKYWISQGFDGFRIDTTKHIEIGFWQFWCPPVHAYAASLGKSNFFMFGEVYDGSDAKCGYYTGTKAGGAFTMDSVLDYPLFFKIAGVFGTATADTGQIPDRYAALAANYDPAAQNRLVTFLDNHDQPRFMSPGIANNNLDRLKVATLFLYTSRGVPCLYYGTEQAFNGTTDPNDREDMFDGGFEQGPSLGDNFNMTHPAFLWIARLNNFRRLYPALSLGAHVNQASNPSGPGLLAYSRRLGSSEILVALNTASVAQSLAGLPTILPAGTTVVNLFDTNEVLTITATLQFPLITVLPSSGKIFVPQSEWQPLDPVVTSNSPAHDAASVPTYSPIVLQFSSPMDTNSVQAAFSTTPSITGSFSWSANRDQLAFTASSLGLPGLSAITVCLTNSAIDGVFGKAMFAPFEFRFKTAASSVQDTNPPVVTILAPTNAARLAGNLVISGTANDNLAVQKVEVALDNGRWTTAAGTASWSFSLNSSNFLNGPHTLFARASDTSGNLATNSVQVRFMNVPGAYFQAISAGNPSSVVDCVGQTWQKDLAYTFGGCGYIGGTTGYMANAISGVCSSAQSLYQRERYSTSPAGFSYRFDCPAGIYQTTLLEAETYWSAAGSRVFNVFIQGQQVLTNFDIFVAAGGKNLPLTRVFTNAVTNAQLEILFTPVVDNARASGVQVRKIADVASDPDGLPDWWRLAFFGHALGQAGDLSRADDDPDGDGASNWNEFLAGTDPLDPASVFHIVSLVATVAGGVQVVCTTVGTRSYQLQRADSPGPASAWSDVGPLRAGTGSNLTLADPGGLGPAPCYYRVQAR